MLLQKKRREKLRVGGSYEKLLKNVETFLKLKYNAKY